MPNLYQEAFATTNSIVKLCLELAKLEKSGKLRTKLYQDMFALLRHMISVENQQKVSVDDSIVREQYENSIKNQSNGNFFLNLDSQMLSSIRFSNRMDSKYLYTLNGCVAGEITKKLQGNLELGFYNELNYLLNQRKLKKEIKNNLIDFKYALIATSPSVGKSVLLSEPILSFTSVEMSDEEVSISSKYIYQFLAEITTYLFSISDIEINHDTLPMALYAKACLKMLPSYVVEPFLDTKKNLLGANRFYGIVEEKSRDQVTKMLTYLLENSSNQKVKK